MLLIQHRKASGKCSTVKKSLRPPEKIFPAQIEFNSFRQNDLPEKSLIAFDEDGGQIGKQSCLF